MSAAIINILYTYIILYVYGCYALRSDNVTLMHVYLYKHCA